MGKIYAIVSCKGGVGKTTSAINLGAYMSLYKKSVCVVDLDPQHNLTRHCGIGQDELRESKTIYDLLQAAIEGDDEAIKALLGVCIRKTSTVDLIPATVKLASIESAITAALHREYLLQSVTTFLREKYDVILIDCRPGLDMLAINALTAADAAVIPVEAHILSSDGLQQIDKTIKAVQRRLNPQLTIEGVIITKYQPRTNYCQSVRELVIRDFGPHVHIYKDTVNYTIKVAEAPAYGISLFEYQPSSTAAQAYASIAEEMMQHD